ncbi:MAG: sulfotransferase domain-containing protein [Deltaproteobacteria bacterium]|nr:sulfotransferase domain-containing protein [Deltaproteobacteria bacterium]MBW2697603.1 sulfotransferase domain-containing protein [Deltaproteobacteria bacterium]
MSTWPSVTREYRNHHLDSTRWRVFEPRADDVVVTTSYKSGTTWMQQILHYLVFRGDPEAPPALLASPWVDRRFAESEAELKVALDGMQHRRFVKSHLPLDGLPYYPQVRYIVVGRDPRDVFMSLWNHYGNYTDAQMKRLNGGEGFTGDPMPPPPPDHEEALRGLWRQWTGRGWFPWETEGWPFWSNLGHTQSYWDFRHLENILLVHYADLLADPAGEIGRVADFIGEAITPEELKHAVESTAIDNMRNAYRAFDEGFKQGFKGGTDAFVYKGTNGRWRGVLGEDDLVLYEQMKARVLSPDCAAWLVDLKARPGVEPSNRLTAEGD